MRITGGVFRGRTLVAPRGEATRPSADRLRAAIFNILEARGAALEGALVLDLFAGTGSLGIEALSRGAARATFVEEAAQALAALDRNLAALGLSRARARVVRGKVRAVLARLARDGERFDLVLLDPPYGADEAGAVVAELAERDLVAPDGFVVAEHGTHEVLPAEAGPLHEVVRRTYGRTAITVYRRAE